MFHQYPYTDFHDLNLDWVVSKIGSINEAEAQTKEYAENAEAAKDTAVGAKDTAVQAKTDAVNAKVAAENARDHAQNSETNAASIVSNTQSQINLLQDRVDNIIPDGTQTAGNTELLDIRVGGNGITYASAGDAVRGQYDELNDALAPIKEEFELMNKIDSTMIEYNKAAVWNAGPPAYMYITSNSNYNSIINIPIKAGTRYIIGPTCRLMMITSSQITADGASYNTVDADNTEHTAPFKYRPTVDGYMHISVRAENNIADEYVGDSRYIDRFYPYGTYYPKMNIRYPELKLAGKTIYNFGDSVAAGYGANDYGYSERVADLNNMTCNDYAVPGASMSNCGCPYGSVIDQIDNAPNDMPDFVVIAGGINDLRYTTLGSMSAIDNFTLTGVDDSKICGGLETAISKAMNKWLGAQILVVFEHRMGSHLTDAIPVLEATKQICAKWSIPLLNMYEDGGLNLGIPAYAAEYGVGGDTHINGDAYNIFYVPKLQAKLIEMINYVKS